MKMDTHTENEEYQNSFPVPLWLLKSFGLVSQIPCRKWFIQTLAFDMEEETGEFHSQLINHSGYLVRCDMLLM